MASSFAITFGQLLTALGYRCVGSPEDLPVVSIFATLAMISAAERSEDWESALATSFESASVTSLPSLSDL